MIKSRSMSWKGHVAHKGKIRNAYSVLIRKLEGKIPPTRPKHAGKNNIKTDLKETGFEGVDWSHLAQDRSR
jgi:hypothetical protein